MYSVESWEGYNILKEDSINTVNIWKIAEVKLVEKDGVQYIFGITNNVNMTWWNGYKLKKEYANEDLFDLFDFYQELNV